MEPPINDDEQWECLDVSARGLRLLKSGLWSDVEFQVGESKDIIKAHSLILSSASSVFEDMLNGSSAESVSPIPVPDVTPEVFNLMLGFVYSDRIQSANIEQVPEFEYVSKKYRMPRLLEAAGVGLIKSLNPDNAIKCYEFATSIMCEALIEECTKVFKYQTAAVLASKGFLHTTLDIVEYIFSLDKLMLASETDLWAALEDYAEANDIRKTEDGEMNVSLSPLLRRIRFSQWETIEMAAHCARFRKLLTDFEVLCLICYNLEKKTKPELSWMIRNPEIRTLKTSEFVVPIVGEVKSGRVFKFHGWYDDQDLYGWYQNEDMIPGYIILIIEFHINQDDSEHKEITKFQIWIKITKEVDFSVWCGRITKNGDNMDTWGEQGTSGKLPIIFEEKLFDLVVAIESDQFEISVNGHKFCSYAHQMPYAEITHVSLDYNFRLKKIFL